MKRIELRRHSVKEGHGNSDLSKEGVALARQVGEKQLKGQGFTHVFVSTLSRTVETLNHMREGAPDLPDEEEVFPPHVQVSDLPSSLELWENEAFQAETRGEDMNMAVHRDAPEKTKQIASAGAKAVHEWLDRMPEHTHALVIGHSPFFEMIAFELFEEMLPQLQPCDGFIITQNENGLTLESVLDAPRLRASNA